MNDNQFEQLIKEVRSARRTMVAIVLFTIAMTATGQMIFHFVVSALGGR